MPRKNCASNGTLCEGDHYTKAPCTLSRAKGRKGEARVMAKKHKCKQWRCSAHCKCNPRPQQPQRQQVQQAQAQQAQQAQQIQQPRTLPMGRPADTHIDVYYDDTAWWDR